ncbi:hypothetical protein [Streptomyces cuspidosporus]|uniref:Uncharacterized protein n=1 Tax=Streptomyces cuspidosporus TaxID=66882 RepID=A0ABN3FLN8_9ACTN
MPRRVLFVLVVSLLNLLTWLGTLLSRLAVYVLPFIVSWLAVLGLFYAFDLPLGPGAGIGQAP